MVQEDYDFKGRRIQASGSDQKDYLESSLKLCEIEKRLDTESTGGKMRDN